MSAPAILVCAGLDPSGGAGLIADVRIASELAARPVGIATALTVQNTQGVAASHPIDPEVAGEQLAALLSDVEVHAVKIGLIGSLEVARALGRALHQTAAPVVWDPVGAPSLGQVRFDRGDFGEILRELSPHLALITPNRHELAALAGAPISGFDAALDAGQALAARAGAAVLVKGGHFGDPVAGALDVLIEGDQRTPLAGPWVAGGEHVHATGCALSTAIAVHLAHRAPLAEACRAAKQYVAARIAAPVRPGRGAAAVV
ncbi:MAG: bifunctional hydroxymethylpyrimidine kinase/phosphomethylpyrimidine kinase [Kofleriaceae bacterium]